jgi:hypothetical protein
LYKNYIAAEEDKGPKSTAEDSDVVGGSVKFSLDLPSWWLTSLYIDQARALLMISLLNIKEMPDTKRLFWERDALLSWTMTAAWSPIDDEDRYLWVILEEKHTFYWTTHGRTGRLAGEPVGVKLNRACFAAREA